MTHEYTFDYRPGATIYWCAADIGWVTGHSYVVYGPLLNGGTSLMFEGVPNCPDFSRFWQVVDKYRSRSSTPPRPPLRALMREGDDWVEKNQPQVAAPARLGRRADQSRGVGMVLPGGRRQPLPDRRHLVADRDRRPHDHPLPGATDAQARQREPCRCSASSPRWSIRPTGHVLEGAAEGALVITDSWPGQMRTVYGDHERFFQTYFSTYKATTSPATAAAATRTAITGSPAGSTT